VNGVTLTRFVAIAVVCLAIALGVHAFVDHALASVTIGGTR